MNNFPNFKQLYQKDCGPNCIKIIAKHYEKDVTIDYLRTVCETNRIGTNLENLGRACDTIGFRSLGVKISLEELNQAPLPCIIHWENEHFLVLYKIKNGEYYISDPAKGLYRINERNFLNGWIGNLSNADTKEGIALLLEVTNSFYDQQEHGEKKQLNYRYFKNYFKSHKAFVWQLLLGLIVSSIIQFLFPFFTQSVVDIGIVNQDIDFIYLILFAQLFLYIGKLSIEIIRDWILLHIGTRIKVTMISDFIIKLMGLPISFFETKQTGDIMQRIQDLNRIRLLLTSSALNIIFSIFNLFVFSIILMIYSWTIFFIFLFGTVLYFLWFILFLKKRALIDYERFTQKSKDYTKLIELIQGMQEIKLNNNEQKKRWSWEKIQVDIYNIDLKWLRIKQYQNHGTSFINEIKNVIITIVAANLVIKGHLTLGMMLSISYIIGQLNLPIKLLLDFLLEFQDAKLSFERLSEITLRKSEHDLNHINIGQIKDNETVSFNNVSFKYPGANKEVLRSITFEIPEKKITAIVGKSGSGKTTLLKLLLKFYEPLKGQINYGKKNLAKISHTSLRNHCGVVMQEGFIFDDTFKNNICLSELYNIEKFERAIKVANLSNFAEELPKGMLTEIGKKGIGISTGEKQRILIARAVYKNPNILIFDEATSSLDTENEKIIVENLDKYYSTKTSVVIAHRLSTVKNADQIIVLEKGEIVEKGTHDELVKLKGFYYHLIKNQLELGE